MFRSVHDLVGNSRWKKERISMTGAIMTAGFPCTPFSKSGHQTGKNHAEGMVFWSVCEIMKDLESPAFIFENVTNLLGKKHENTWEEMKLHLIDDLGYRIGWAKISTKDLGIPQNRERVFLVGVKSDSPDTDFFKEEFQEILKAQIPMSNLNDLLRTTHKRTSLSDAHKGALLVWDQYLNWLVENPKLLKSLPKPLWGMEGHYRKIYDINKLQEKIDKNFPAQLTKSQISSSLTVSNEITKSMSKQKMIQKLLPPYYRNPVMGESTNYEDRFKFARKSQYHMHLVEKWVIESHGIKTWENWIGQLMQLETSFQKLETFSQGTP